MQAQAQEKFYAKHVDNFEENWSWDLADYDSIVWFKSAIRLYKHPDSLGKVRSTLRTYTKVRYFSFNDPGRIIYRPNEFSSMNFDSESSRWCWTRSKQSEHFIVFWESGFGNDPTTSSPSFNPDVLLERAEMLFDYYADSLGFVIPGQSRSTDKYKIEIYVNYSTDWLATGSGYDDKIGALWCTPWAINSPSTVAHEIGHSFQYLVSCDLGTNHGYRWGYTDDGSGGCAWWESCAQWQAYKVYPAEQFANSYYSQCISSSHLNLLHEEWRYANFFIQDYWTQLHGKKFIGSLWRASKSYEDPVQTYQRMLGVSQSEFCDMMYDYARRAITWDIDGIRERGKSYQDAFSTSMTQSADDDNTWTVDSASAPQNYGFNSILLNNATAGTTIKAQFKGFTSSKGYRSVNPSYAGWRYGFVAQLQDGSRVYGDMYSDKEGTAEFTVPENVAKTWFVVSGAPTTHFRHPWNDDVSDDEQWPYTVTFVNTNKYGSFGEYPADYARRDTTITVEATLPRDAYSYSSVSVTYDMAAISQALGLSTAQMKSLGSSSSSNPSFCAVTPQGKYVYTPLTTTSGTSYFGHWFSSAGYVTDYGSSAYIFAEINRDTYKVNIGQYPNRLVKGKTYTIRQAIRYKADDGNTYTATIIVKVTVS